MTIEQRFTKAAPCTISASYPVDACSKLLGIPLLVPRTCMHKLPVNVSQNLKSKYWAPFIGLFNLIKENSFNTKILLSKFTIYFSILPALNFLSIQTDQGNLSMLHVPRGQESGFFFL